MVGLTGYAQRRLNSARRAQFSDPVTAFITDALLVAGCCYGVTHAHVRASAFGWFQDGHRICSSDVKSVERSGSYWSVHTESGSHYVIVTFNRLGGRKSIDAFLKLSKRGLHATASWFH